MDGQILSAEEYFVKLRQLSGRQRVKISKNHQGGFPCGGWDELTKKQRKHIREMAGVAYEREMAAALNKLLETFQKWKRGAGRL